MPDYSPDSPEYEPFGDGASGDGSSAAPAAPGDGTSAAPGAGDGTSAAPGAGSSAASGAPIMVFPYPFHQGPLVVAGTMSSVGSHVSVVPLTASDAIRLLPQFAVSAGTQVTPLSSQQALVGSHQAPGGPEVVQMTASAASDVGAGSQHWDTWNEYDFVPPGAQAHLVLPGHTSAATGASSAAPGAMVSAGIQTSQASMASGGWTLTQPPANWAQDAAAITGAGPCATIAGSAAPGARHFAPGVSAIPKQPGPLFSTQLPKFFAAEVTR